ncbi:MAG: SDR family oxidoreductase [Microbacterium ginsengisoli]|nr:SDR family oxidoreductase [Microbacterium ginsengisoli]
MNTAECPAPVALLTGAASGIGKAAALRLAADGFSVVIADLDEDAAEAVARGARELGAQAHSVQLDVRSQESCNAAVAVAGEAFGRLDALVCAAGIGVKGVTSWEVEESQWNAMIDVNLTGTFRTCKAAIPLMLETASPARIVLVASIAGKDGNPKMAAYSASKGGVIALGKTLGKELARTNVLVNTVVPALIRTPLILGPGDPSDDLAALIPMGRIGEPEEAAELISWLSTTVSFSTGATYDLSGGRATY